MNDWITDLTEHVRTDPNWANSAFAYQMPQDGPDPAVMLIPPIEGIQNDLYLPDRYVGRFQALIRTGIIAQAHSKASEIYRLLRLRNQTVGGFTVVRCEPVNIPVVYPKSDSDLFEASVTFDLIMIDTRIRTGS